MWLNQEKTHSMFFSAGLKGNKGGFSRIGLKVKISSLLLIFLLFLICDWKRPCFLQAGGRQFESVHLHQGAGREVARPSSAGHGLIAQVVRAHA